MQLSKRKKIAGVPGSVHTDADRCAQPAGWVNLALAGFSTPLLPTVLPPFFCARFACASVGGCAHVSVLCDPGQVIVAGPAGHQATEGLLDAAHAAWAPDKALILIDPTNPDSAGFWKQHNPEAWAMVDAHYSKQGRSADASAAPEPAGSAQEAAEAADMGLQPAAAAEVAGAGAGADAGRFPPTAFVCQNFTCQAPTTEAAKVVALLSSQAGMLKLQPVKL